MSVHKIFSLIEISEQIKSFIIEENPANDFELTEDSYLLEDWFIDSLSILNLVMFLEDTFKVEFDRKDIKADNFETIRILSSYIYNKI